MAAPPFLPQSPATSSHAAGNAASTPSTPRSPGTRQREQQRMDLLMEINVELLQEVSKLQAEGKGGATTPQHAAQLKQQGQPSDLASQEYIDALRHVQANFTYLMPAAQGDASKTPQGPALLGPPAHMPQLQPKYDKLKELFPGWPGLDQRGGHSSASPQPNGTAT
ncbi:hypothetical protein EJ03DRAFT_324659 [Teratosphaeria nubilosa]|uniref:Uncharacterized protein n=1 Tax=Teratosphaeria nubilosa TaxID=161662 RepID=A0A6G1LJB6_9PEZI|nr:hypothetical protein EJ03DRAFT_324659 [Teratosphaeria nubilosa]